MRTKTKKHVPRELVGVALGLAVLAVAYSLFRAATDVPVYPGLGAGKPTGMALGAGPAGGRAAAGTAAAPRPGAEGAAPVPPAGSEGNAPSATSGEGAAR